MTSLVASAISLEARLRPSDLVVTPGQMVAVVGPNGGGKTSLLRALARVERAGGRVDIDGENLDQAPEARRRQLLAFLPASRDIGWPICVRDVIALGLTRRDPDRIDDLLTSFELGPLANRPVDRLSTGERARVLMARVLAARPKLLLLDEPLSNLDPYWVLRFLDLFRDCASKGQMLLVALHDISLVGRFNRALLVADGRVQMDETPANLLASERFEEIFRVRRDGCGDWAIRAPG
ncbi:MAG: ABC transporter ATP-binding protein [Sphingomicrobium sp.]